MRIYLRTNKRKLERLIKVVLWSTIIVTFTFYLTFPIIFKSSPFLQRHFIFENDGNLNEIVNLSNPKNSDLAGSIHHFLPTASGITLGIWQILPIDLVPSLLPLGEDANKKWFLDQLGDNRAIVLYCHGNKPSRATYHRVLLYKVLQKLNFHVITFDYRGFADSTQVDPTEEGVVEDTLHMVNFIRSHSQSPLYVFGHSLGTGIATKAVAMLCKTGQCPKALILQSPFTSIQDEIKSIKLTLPFRILPWFNFMFVSPLMSQGLVFNSEEHIQHVSCPILILHAEDDSVVPFTLGKKLYQTALGSRKSDSGLVKFVSFDKKYQYGHNFICQAPDLPFIILDFLKQSLTRN